MEKDGGGESEIFCKHFLKVKMYPWYNYNVLTNKRRNKHCINLFAMGVGVKNHNTAIHTGCN